MEGQLLLFIRSTVDYKKNVFDSLSIKRFNKIRPLEKRIRIMISVSTWRLLFEKCLRLRKRFIFGGGGYLVGEAYFISGISYFSHSAVVETDWNA